jgi:hypothetical protein
VGAAGVGAAGVGATGAPGVGAAGVGAAGVGAAGVGAAGVGAAGVGATGVGGVPDVQTQSSTTCQLDARCCLTKQCNRSKHNCHIANQSTFKQSYVSSGSQRSYPLSFNNVCMPAAYLV